MAILSLAEAKASLNITGTTYDAELPDYITAAQECVDFLCGPSEAVTATEYVDLTGSCLVLRTTPALSLTSVTGDIYGAVDVTTLRLSLTSGVIRVKGTNPPLRDDTYTVVIQAGRSSTPKSIVQGAKIILAHQWKTQRGALRPNLAGMADDVSQVPGLGYAIPNRALQILDPYLRGPGVG